MDHLRAPSLQSLLESERGSTDSLLADSLQLDVEELDDIEYAIPPTTAVPSLETVLSEFEADSDIASELGVPSTTITPTPSIADDAAGMRSGGAGGSGSIMRNTTLQAVSAQIASAAERVNSGLASACAVAAFIAVGTSHGHILNFDVTQTLRWAYQDKHSNGAVSTLAYNSDSTRLLAGYARGLIVMLDTQSGDCLRTLFDAVTPNTGVLHVKWTSRPALALCSDSGGSVWSLSFTRKLGIRSCASRCLFSGARGEVCAFEPLVMEDATTGHHELDQYCIAALATLSKYFIVTIRPRLKVIKYHTLQGPSDCLPMLAWQMVLIQAVDTSRSVDPVLVVGRGNQLFFHQLFMSNGRITLLYLRHVTMQENLLSAHWLGPKCVGCLDISEILHLIDVRSSKELECIDLANAGLVYGSAHFKGLATGGNVSPALALAGSHACYNSIASQGTQLYILGARSLHIIGVRSWSERITFLVKNQRWQEACDLALEGYRVAAERPKRRAQAKQRIIMLFNEYLTASSHAPDYCLSAIIKCLIAVDELDLLWTQLWERVQHSAELFLQHITDHIENDSIHRISPAISQALVDYWLKISPAKLEELILKLDWTCLDLNQVLRAAKSYKLYRAQIYLNTRALNDYTVSLTELIPLVETESEISADLGNCLLVYISSCLAGRGYPNGEIPTEWIQTVKHDVLRCLTSLHTINSNVEGHGTGSGSDELPYPYLRALLKFDTRETLNVISLAFQEREFSGEAGFSHRKRIINILLEIMTPDNATWAEIGCLLNFIAQQISLGCLPREAQLLQTVLNYLAEENIANESTRQHSERESAWHELLANNCLEQISSDEEQLQLANKARCHYVAEYLLEKLQRYDTILECYLNNKSRHDTMFAYIERHVGNPDRKIYKQVKEHLKELLSINPTEITRIIDFHFTSRIDELLDSLRGNDEEQFYVFLFNLNKRRAHLKPEQNEELLELLCKRTPELVVEFLKGNTNYRVDKALSIVQHHKLTDAVIYLYEKKESYRKAFDLALEQLKTMNSTEDAEAYAKEVSSLCLRASTKLSAIKEREQLWFELIKFVLKREDLKAITKSLLHDASQYVDLANLVQLIMSMGNVSGNFGDIKDLLMSMLSQSRCETQALEATSELLGKELHDRFARHQREACRGIWVTTMRCVVCQNRLYNQDSILILGACGHAMHNKCAESYEDAFKEACLDMVPADLRELAQQMERKSENAKNQTPPKEKTIDHSASASDSKNPFDETDEEENDDDEDEDGADNIFFLTCPQCRVQLPYDYLSKQMDLSQGQHRVVTTNLGDFDPTQNGGLGMLRLKAPPRRI